MIPFKDEDAAREELLEHVNSLSLVVAVVVSAVALVLEVFTPG